MEAIRLKNQIDIFDSLYIIEEEKMMKIISFLRSQKYLVTTKQVKSRMMIRWSNFETMGWIMFTPNDLEEIQLANKRLMEIIYCIKEWKTKLWIK